MVPKWKEASRHMYLKIKMTKYLIEELSNLTYRDDGVGIKRS